MAVNKSFVVEAARTIEMTQKLQRLVEYLRDRSCVGGYTVTSAKTSIFDVSYELIKIDGPTLIVIVEAIIEHERQVLKKMGIADDDDHPIETGKTDRT